MPEEALIYCPRWIKTWCMRCIGLPNRLYHWKWNGMDSGYGVLLYKTKIWAVAFSQFFYRCIALKLINSRSNHGNEEPSCKSKGKNRKQPWGEKLGQLVRLKEMIRNWSCCWLTKKSIWFWPNLGSFENTLSLRQPRLTAFNAKIDALHRTLKQSWGSWNWH